MLAFALGELRRHRLEAIDALEGREHAKPARRLVGTSSLAVVEIENRIRREHGVVALCRSCECAVDAAPRHDHRGAREVALEDLVPTDEAPAALVEEASNAIREIGLQARRIGDAELTHALE